MYEKITTVAALFDLAGIRKNLETIRDYQNNEADKQTRISEEAKMKALDADIEASRAIHALNTIDKLLGE